MTFMLAIAVVSVVLFLLSVPVAFALGLSCLFVMVLWPGAPLLLVAQKTLNGMDSFPLLAIPFFLLASSIMNVGSITDRVIDVFNGIVGRVRGGLGMVNVVVNVFLAGISGSAVADATATGSILIPAMKRDGYPGPFAAGLTAAAAVCGPIIPPSIPMVIYGVVAHVSILKLFLAGYLPGFMLGGLLLAYVWYVARRRGFPMQPKVGVLEIVTRVRRGSWALLMPVILVAGILLGVFTVTELGAVLVIYAMLVSIIIYHQLPLRAMPTILLQVGLDAANIMFIVGTSTLLAYLIAINQIPSIIVTSILSITHSKFTFFILLNGILLIAGTFLDSTPATIILAPIFLPIAKALGIDPVHLGIVVVFNLMIGTVHPPVGLNLYVTSKIANESISRVIVELVPMYAILIAVLAFITYAPGPILWLPSLLDR
jgi:tripartite ATP-independent transporter DctM subunit